MSEINALLITSDFRGDHAADVRVAIATRSTDTIGELIERAGLTKPEDHIEIRLVRAREASDGQA